MRNLYKYFVLLLLLSISFSSFSQKKNSVKIHSQALAFLSSEVRYPNLTTGYTESFYLSRLTAILGISYERTLWPNKGLGGHFFFWRGHPYKNYHTDATTYSTINNWHQASSVGKIVEGYNFKTYDIYGFYELNLNEKVHLRFKAGPSITSGEHLYLLSVHPTNPNPDTDNFFTEYETKKETYFGAFTSASLSYNLWKGRIPVGIDLVGRYYHNFPFQLNYGLHTGFNF